MTTEQKTLVPPRRARVANHGLAPVAYNDTVLPALRLARSSRIARRIARTLLIMLGATILVVLVAPWQQAVTGSGNVVAFAPLERQQLIEAPVNGRIVRWGEDIYENAYVEKGQAIVEIEDIDPLMLDRLRDQLEMTRQQQDAVRQQLDASENSHEAAKTVVTSYELQRDAYRMVKTQLVAAADAYVRMAEQKVAAEKNSLQEQEAALLQEEADFHRQKALFDKNIVSEVRFQVAERKFRETKAKVDRARAHVTAAERELEGKRNERDAVERQAEISIDAAEAALRTAHGNVAKADSDVAKARNDLNRVKNEVVSMQSRISRQESQIVRAPRSGYILRITANEGGEIVKQGDPLCVIVPDTQDQAVQIWLLGNDAPLVEPGRHVRLQFEGWPAVQFAGWPSVAVGTFGGTVASVDATDDGKGRFRCLIIPDKEDQEWPRERFLRQGVRANGWVLLERVPLWYEVWRRLNGFPPAIDMDDRSEGGTVGKIPKLPKAS
jgi:multidrug resistance efflux pump